MSEKKAGPISFTLDPEYAKALRTLAGNRKIRLSGTLQSDRLVVDFVACNAAFVACNAPFMACNAPFRIVSGSDE